MGETFEKRYSKRTKKQLIEELKVLHKRVARLEKMVGESVGAEELIRASEQHLRSIVDNSMDVAMITNPDLTMRYVSPSVELILGYKPEELVGRSVLDFLSIEHAQLVEDLFGQAIKTSNFYQNNSTPAAVEVNFLHKDGTVRIIEGIATNLFDDPLVRGILSTSRDVTERRRVEEERVKLATDLARLEELQLSMQRILEAQEQVRRDIAQQLHGSVQNRLIVSLHRLAELERKARPGELEGDLKDLHHELEELLNSYVRPISHRLYPAILRRGLVATLQSMRNQFESSLDIEMDMDDELTQREKVDPQLILEQVRLVAYRIAEEALTNVVKHAVGNAGTIKVNLIVKMLTEKWLKLIIRDSAQGFDMARVSGGRGLMMMQDYAEVVGGRCVILSVPGKGTEVTASLPLSKLGEEHR